MLESGLSPAYDLPNSRIHIDDQDFALADGLLPKQMARGKIAKQFTLLAQKSGIPEKISQNITTFMLSKTTHVEKLIAASFLDASTKRNYFQTYQRRLKQLGKS